MAKLEGKDLRERVLRMFRAMASKLLLLLAVLVFVVDGHLPGMRDLRNPDCEGGKGAGRTAHLSKRAEA